MLILLFQNVLMSIITSSYNPNNRNRKVAKQAVPILALIITSSRFLTNTHICQVSFASKWRLIH